MTDRLELLWAPHRMAYVTGRGQRRSPTAARSAGSPASTTVPGSSWRAASKVYAVLNKHPYNPGHLMVVPYRHVAELEDLTDAEARGSGMTRQRSWRSRASSPHGFNVGLNLGGVAGGSLADHLHQHVVPRWGGDANFMTVIGTPR